MPLLSGLVITLFGGLFAQFATIFGTRMAVAAAAVTAVSLLTVAFFAAMAALAATITAGFPTAHSIGLGLWLFVPSNTPACLAAIVTCDTACSLYRWKMTNIRIMAGA
jgi:hypothetical protein